MAKQVATSADVARDIAVQASNGLERLSQEARALSEQQNELQRKHETILKIRENLEKHFDKPGAILNVGNTLKLLISQSAQLQYEDNGTALLSDQGDLTYEMEKFKQLGIEAAKEVSFGRSTISFSPQQAMEALSPIILAKTPKERHAAFAELWKRNDEAEITADGPAVAAAAERADYLKKILNGDAPKKSVKEKA